MKKLKVFKDIPSIMTSNINNVTHIINTRTNRFKLLVLASKIPKNNNTMKKLEEKLKVFKNKFLKKIKFTLVIIAIFISYNYNSVVTFLS